MTQDRANAESSFEGARQRLAARAPGAVAAALALMIPVGLMLGGTPESPRAVALAQAACLVVTCALFACALAARRAGQSTSRIGPYTLGAKIGEGGMGVVYRAEHASLRRATALKVLPKERANARNRARFALEAQRTRELSHPNTISIFDVGQTPEGLAYYAMEYVDGVDLQALVERDGPLSPSRVAGVLVQVLAALAEVHRRGLVHRDVKPANVMLVAGERDAVKLLDFGLAQDLGSTRAHDPNELVGTPLYLAPEALTTPERVDERSDLYAVGALGYFLLTGTPPFSGRNVLDVCAQHLHGVPVPPSVRAPDEIPRELEALLLQCLEKSPDARPRSAELLRRALEPLAAEPGQRSLNPGVWGVREERCALA